MKVLLQGVFRGDGVDLEVLQLFIVFLIVVCFVIERWQILVLKFKFVNILNDILHV